jgi:hypothetical protein
MFTMTATKPYHNNNFQIKNLLTLSMTITVSILLFFQYFIDYKTLSFLSEKFIFFKEPLFYIALSLNFWTQYLGRLSNKQNEKNLIFGQFANFILIAMVPIVSYLMLLFVDFDNTIDVKYESFTEMIFISCILFVLSLFFFIDKIKSKVIVRLDVLILFIVVSTVNFVLINKLMQMYEAQAVYFCTMVFNSIIWIIMAKKQNEIERVEKRHYSAFVIFGLVYILYSYINIIIVNYLPSEHIAIFRTIAAVLSTAFFDFLNAKRVTLSIKDVIILILIFSTLYMLNF